MTRISVNRRLLTGLAMATALTMLTPADPRAGCGAVCYAQVRGEFGYPACTADGSVLWYAQAEALWLDRDQPQRIPFSGIDVTGFGDVVIVQTTDDLDFNFEAGPRMTIGRHLAPMISFDLTYFGLHDFNARSQATDPNGELLSPYSQFDPFSFGNSIGFDGAHVHTLDYGSELHNAEANLRFRCESGGPLSGSLLGGFRYIHASEDFTFRSIEFGGGFGGVDARGLYAVDTENNLYGLQLGGDLTYDHSDILRFITKAKAGLFLAEAEQNSVFEQDFGAVNRVEFRADGESLGSLIEVGLQVALQLRPAVALTAGYDVLVVGGVALAPEQFDPNNGVFGAHLDNGGRIVYHGPSAGFVAAW